MRNKFSVLLLIAVMVTAFITGRMIVVAQGWSNPVNDPPTLNPGQPPTADNLTGYVKKSSTTIQILQGQWLAGQSGSQPSEIGGDDSDTESVSLIGSGSSGVPTLYSDGDTGVYAYGVTATHGVYGYSDASSGFSYGVAGIGSGGLYAGRFYGPVTVSDNAVSGASGSITVTNQGAQIDQGLHCLESNGCTISGTWITGTHTNDGIGIYGIGDTVPGIALIVDDSITGSSTINADANTGYAAVGYAPGSSGATAVYGYADAIPAQTTVGVSGIHRNIDSGTYARKGVYGQTLGGVGSTNYSSDIFNPEYDHSAGIRACVKSAGAAMVSKRGVYGGGAGTVAGYFYGDQSGQNAGDIYIASVCSDNTFQYCDDDSDCSSGTCEGRLQIGSTYLTKTNLKGLICRANGVSVGACFSSVCGNGVLETGEECDDGNTANNDGCSSTCTDETFSHRVQITFNTTGLTETLTDVPVLLNLDGTDINFTNLQQADADDIRVYDSGLAPLDYELEHYNGINRLYIWVKVPEINPSRPDSIYLYYGNSSVANGENAESVWSNGYVGVWHFSEDPEVSSDCSGSGGSYEFCDSTSNNNDGDTLGDMVNADRVFNAAGAYAYDFDGIDDYLNITNDASLGITDDITMSFWFNQDDQYSYAGIISKTDGEFDWDYDLYMTGGTPEFYSGGWTEYFWMSSGESITDESLWHDVYFTRDAGAWSFYIDGTLYGNGTDTTLMNNNPFGLRIATDGPEYDGATFYDGMLDEVRVSNVSRSADWIDVQNRNFNNSFVTVGSEEAL